MHGKYWELNKNDYTGDHMLVYGSEHKDDADLVASDLKGKHGNNINILIKKLKTTESDYAGIDKDTFPSHRWCVLVKVHESDHRRRR